jgi:hypothetical protein
MAHSPPVGSVNGVDSGGSPALLLLLTSDVARLMGVLGSGPTHERGHAMKRLMTLAVVAALMSAMTALGQNYTFGD